jgi:hypothetical protein
MGSTILWSVKFLEVQNELLFSLNFVYVLQKNMFCVCPFVYVDRLPRYLYFPLRECLLTNTNIPSTSYELQYQYVVRNSNLGVPFAVVACVTLGINILIYNQQNLTHEFLHVGCSRLWARASTHLQAFCHFPAQLIMEVDYQLPVRGTYSGTHRWQTVFTVSLSER